MKREADHGTATEAAGPSPRRQRSFGETTLAAALPDTEQNRPETKATLTVLSLNVHGFHNEECSAFDGLVTLLRATSPDVIALQESSKHRLPALAKALGGLHWTVRHNCAVLSRFALNARESYNASGAGSARRSAKAKDTFKRYCVASISPWAGFGPVDICCMHLDHVKEPTRLEQLRCVVEQQLESDARPPCQIWLGDFNALSRGDCTEAEWARIAEHRVRCSWEAPMSEVTSAMTTGMSAAASKKGFKKETGFTDCWRVAEERRGPLGTSRFDTRIDYIYCSPALMEGAVVRRCEHLQTIPHVSDHNAVCVCLERRGDGGKI